MKLWRVIAGVLALGFVVAGVTPAWACACGGYMTDVESRARAAGEKALVRYDGRGTEEITLSMAIDGSSKKAAWIMPVPNPAKVELGDAELFRRLEQLTAPKVVKRTTYWPFRGLAPFDRDGYGSGEAPTAAGGVSVREQMTLGPFEIARLGGNSATAVTDWLRTNQYVVPDTLGANLTPYVREGWEIVAVKLTPKSAGESLTGATPPLRLTFASDKIVYPMRLSKGATTAQSVAVHVAAPYRVDATALPVAGQQPELIYAGRANDPALLAPADYLTTFRVTYYEPGRITSDFTFAKAATDEPFQQVRYVTRNEARPSTLAILLGVPLLIGGGFALFRRRSRLQDRAG
ncbi:DUF2330 domain-containing protein [Kribbella albertanoniae]|uniref:DUF2330 domain-containing protein n=1 Tax=Kribbella albertanoniae TaxID=1266829 RepID=A0A4R4QFS5_9ACTN|nr:DUF2330 domain-containing protein [Kribbella albertanoniae]TDC34330.1 DUF2330 domain-containing protein [Kribbella albertanoniae]